MAAAFLSHTAELAQHPFGRSFVDEATDAIRRAGWRAVAVADDPYGRRPVVPCAERIASASMWIGLIGFRYGQVVRGVPNRSHVELEHDLAQLHERPRLVCLLDDHAPALPPEAVIDRTTGARQERFRARLRRDGAPILTFGSPGELHCRLFRWMLRAPTAPSDALWTPRSPMP
ncbi:MAG: hypothetical protein S0880_05305 [Actinomycetota bacterium]|nr:hypothetical protein [Actinomycetota bacterium]